jgi:dihydrofolate reductase
MRKLIYYVAISTDGFIAAPDGSFDDFPMQGEHFADLIADFPETFPAPARSALGITAPNRMFDTVLMGRATYEVGQRAGLASPYPHLEQYVVSSRMERDPDPAVKLVGTDPVQLVQKLKARDGLAMWLCGGGKLAAALFDEIDEVVVKINPVILGAGIAMFARAVRPKLMRLLDRKVYPNGFVRMHHALK